MIDIYEVRDMISHMRKIGSDTQACEVKEAAQGLPKSIGETISAFANMSGGLIILGLSEKKALPTFWGNRGLDGALVEVRTGS